MTLIFDGVRKNNNINIYILGCIYRRMWDISVYYKSYSFRLLWQFNL